MDARNQGLGIITKQWPKRRNRFEALFGFAGTSQNQIKENAAVTPHQEAQQTIAFTQEHKKQPKQKKRRIDFFGEQKEKAPPISSDEAIADLNMDIATGEVLIEPYKGRTLSAEEKSFHFDIAFKHYVLAIEAAKKEGKDASLDVYFSCLNALELRSRIDLENKSALLEKTIKFMNYHNLEEKIAASEWGREKKMEYIKSAQSYVQVYEDYLSSKEQSSRFTF